MYLLCICLYLANKVLLLLLLRCSYIVNRILLECKNNELLPKGNSNCKLVSNFHNTEKRWQRAPVCLCTAWLHHIPLLASWFTAVCCLPADDRKRRFIYETIPLISSPAVTTIRPLFSLAKIISAVVSSLPIVLQMIVSSNPTFQENY